MFIEKGRESLSDTKFLYIGIFQAIKDVEEYQARLYIERKDEEWVVYEFAIEVKGTYRSIRGLYSRSIYDSILGSIQLPSLPVST